MDINLRKVGNTFNTPTKFFKCDSTDDMATINAVAGDECFVINENKTYIMNFNSEWKQIQSTGSSGELDTIKSDGGVGYIERNYNIIHKKKLDSDYQNARSWFLEDEDYNDQSIGELGDVIQVKINNDTYSCVIKQHLPRSEYDLYFLYAGDLELHPQMLYNQADECDPVPFFLLIGEWSTILLKTSTPKFSFSLKNITKNQLYYSNKIIYNNCWSIGFDSQKFEGVNKLKFIYNEQEYVWDRNAFSAQEFGNKNLSDGLFNELTTLNLEDSLPFYISISSGLAVIFYDQYVPMFKVINMDTGETILQQEQQQIQQLTITGHPLYHTLGEDIENICIRYDNKNYLLSIKNTTIDEQDIYYSGNLALYLRYWDNSEEGYDELDTGQSFCFDYSYDEQYGFGLNYAIVKRGSHIFELLQQQTIIHKIDDKFLFSNNFKQALLACFEKVAWIDNNGQSYYNRLSNALDGIAPKLISITANYTGGEVPANTPVSELQGITVFANFSDGSQQQVYDYELSGSISVGENTITVTYLTKTTTFTVTGTVIDTSPRILYENKTWNTNGNADNLNGSCLTEFYEFTPDLEGLKKTRYWDEANQYATVNGAFYTIAYIAPNTSGVAFSSKGKTIYTLADGSYNENYYTTARTTSAENFFQGRNQKPEICIADNYPLKISFNLTIEDKEDSYAYWKASTYTGLTPVGTRDGDIIFAGRNTPYYGMQNIHDAD